MHVLHIFAWVSFVFLPLSENNILLEWIDEVDLALGVSD